MSSQSCAGGFAGIALASSLALHWRPCKHRAVVAAGIALASSPTSCWPLCPNCAGIASRNANWHLPNQDAVAARPCAWRHCRGRHPCPWPHRHTWHCSTVTWPSMVWPMQHWRLCWRCAGVLGRIALASSKHCAVVVTGIAPASSPLLCRRFCLSRWYCCPCRLRVAASIINWHLPSHEAVATRAGIIASIAPTLLPALRRHHHPRCVGIFALVALALSPSSHPCCCQNHELASAQS
jgi:hypothetical protein